MVSIGTMVEDTSYFNIYVIIYYIRKMSISQTFWTE